MAIGGIDLLLMLPELVLALLGLVVLGLDLFYLRRRRLDGVQRSNFLGYFILGALVFISLLSLVLGPNSPLQRWFPGTQMFYTELRAHTTAFGGAFVLDGVTPFVRVIFFLAAALVLLLSLERSWNKHEGEYYALVIFATLGLSLMSGAGDLITIYVALELTSIALYLLASMNFTRRSIEAGLKYFLFGAFSSALLLYGLSLIYGFTGTTSLAGIAQEISLHGQLKDLMASGNWGLLMGLVFLVAGLGFKVTLVPFQSWAPDVYEGAPTPITAFISTGSKVASFVVILRLLVQALSGLAGVNGAQWPPLQGWRVILGPLALPGQGWTGLLAILAVLTFTVANLMAMPQRNVKRLLAYSSIAHAGYLLIGVILVASQDGGRAIVGMQAIFYYLAAYVVTNIGAFATVIAVSRAAGGEELDNFAGLSKRSLPLAGALTVLFFSLAGVPPLAGFFAKFWLFLAAFNQGLIWLAAAGLINTIVAFYYYLRVLRAVWFEKPAEESTIVVGDAVSVVLLATTVIVIVVGVIPNLLLPYLETVARAFFPG